MSSNQPNESIEKNNKLICSGFLLCVALIIFSVVIPNIQNQIDSIREKRHTYEKNVMTAQAESRKATSDLEIFNALTALKNGIAENQQNLINAIDSIRTGYHDSARTSVAKEIFLLTEPVEGGQPDKDRLISLTKKQPEELKTLSQQAGSHMTKYVLGLHTKIRNLERIRLFLYIFAPLAYIIGTWLGIVSSKNPQADTLIKEVRNLSNRVNKLLKKKG